MSRWTAKAGVHLHGSVTPPREESPADEPAARQPVTGLFSSELHLISEEGRCVVVAGSEPHEHSPIDDKTSFFVDVLHTALSRGPRDCKFLSHAQVWHNVVRLSAVHGAQAGLEPAPMPIQYLPPHLRDAGPGAPHPPEAWPDVRTCVDARFRGNEAPRPGAARRPQAGAGRGLCLNREFWGFHGPSDAELPA